MSSRRWSTGVIILVPLSPSPLAGEGGAGGGPALHLPPPHPNPPPQGGEGIILWSPLRRGSELCSPPTSRRPTRRRQAVRGAALRRFAAPSRPLSGRRGKQPVADRTHAAARGLPRRWAG